MIYIILQSMLLELRHVQSDFRTSRYKIRPVGEDIHEVCYLSHDIHIVLNDDEGLPVLSKSLYHLFYFLN